MRFADFWLLFERIFFTSDEFFAVIFYFSDFERSVWLYISGFEADSNFKSLNIPDKEDRKSKEAVFQALVSN